MVTTISALGRRSLFATFLTPKTFLFRPSIVLPTFSPSHVRYTSSYKLQQALAAKNQLIGPYKKRFAEQLWRAGVSTWPVEEQSLLPQSVIELQSIVRKAIENIPSSQHAFELPPLGHLNETELLSIILPRLFRSLDKTDRYTGQDRLWKDQRPLCPELQTCEYPR